MTCPGSQSWYPSVGPRNWDGHFEGCGPWYAWLCELGYPNLDVQQWVDGEWAIIEFYQAPVIPSITRWNFVLQGLRNIEIGRGFLSKYIQQLNLQRKEVWDAADLRDKRQDEEKLRLDTHAQDTAEKAKNIIMQTPTLVERIAETGNLAEMNLDKIVKHIPSSQLIGYKGAQ